MSNILKITFTGHRYLSLRQVESYLNKLHEDFPGAIWVTGGAVGLDSVASSFAMSHNIRLWLILPFQPKVMTKYWSAAQREVLDRSVKYCDKLSVLSLTYDKSIYQRRNERMVDLSDMVAAFWDGSNGGTGNCVRYAQSIGKRMIRFSDFSGTKPQEEGSPSPSYREIHGDIFTSGAEAIVNTVNCVGVMGKGIALEFKRRYPDLFKAYRTACSRGELSAGKVWIYRTKDSRIIFNCAVKDDWRNPSKIEWVESCLNELVQLCRSNNVESLALPWMGAMNGWIPVEQIKTATRRVLSGATDIDISVYEIRNI
jgi:O-acetyl-ADP-ribose deacetylase (regulator of RNase III)/uncharacterized phage-like protein YoqJ